MAWKCFPHYRPFGREFIGQTWNPFTKSPVVRILRCLPKQVSSQNKRTSFLWFEIPWRLCNVIILAFWWFQFTEWEVHLVGGAHYSPSLRWSLGRTGALVLLYTVTWAMWTLSPYLDYRRRLRKVTSMLSYMLVRAFLIIEMLFSISSSHQTFRIFFCDWKIKYEMLTC